MTLLTKMLLFLLFQLFFVIVVSKSLAAKKEEGTKCFKDFDTEKYNQNRILGGSECYQGQWPFAVQILLRDSNCTGSIISSRYILTASHCIYGKGNHALNPPPASDLKVIVGSIKFAQNGIIHEVEEFVPHYGYNPIGDNDIALLKLKTPIAFNDAAKPICLTKNFPDTFKKVVAIGFGATAKNSSKMIFNKGANKKYEIIAAGGICKFVDVPLQKDDVCKNANLPTNRTLHYNPGDEICGGGIWKGTLEGDSGGPLIGMYESGEYYQIGVTARGEDVPNNRGENPRDFGVYTKVSKHCEWITEKTENEIICA